MVRFWITALCILAFIEYYSVGVMLLAKKAGEKDAKKCLIPFYAFFVVGRLTGGFKVLSIPVKKFHIVMVEYVAFILLAILYACWGDLNLPRESSEALWEIMWVVIALMAFLACGSLIVSSARLFRRFNVKRENITAALCLFMVTIPVIYAYVSRNEPKAFSDMY